MPLKRTPPKSPGKNQKKVSTPTLSETSKTVNIKTCPPQMTSATTDNSPSQYSQSVPSTDDLSAQRGKRKFDGSDHSDMRAFMAEMRMHFSNFTTNQDNKLLDLQKSITEIKKQNEEIFKSIDFISQKYDDLSLKISKLEDDKKESQNYITALEERLDFLEKKSRSTYVEIRNIPKMPSETKKSLSSLVEKIGQKLNVTIELRDIKDIYRINTKSDDNKPIILELTTVALKDNLIDSIKKFNKVRGADNFNTEHLQISGSPKKVYIGDSLTPKQKRLFYLAREFAKANDYSYCWSTNGNIYLRKREGTSHFRVVSELDLDKIKENE
ncbi:unnamed protein product [Chilo suppressalis]|uniref:FP protein C-terminal domain-containing protein n=1 Tax=Chilo suppressalis TaxID=168631 RepID=A0ABN8BGA9_CHISP|nr:unnamed protein product [Chilo suppressalis]